MYIRFCCVLTRKEIACKTPKKESAGTLDPIQRLTPQERDQAAQAGRELVSGSVNRYDHELSWKKKILEDPQLRTFIQKQIEECKGRVHRTTRECIHLYDQGALNPAPHSNFNLVLGHALLPILFGLVDDICMEILHITGQHIGEPYEAEEKAEAEDSE